MSPQPDELPHKGDWTFQKDVSIIDGACISYEADGGINHFSPKEIPLSEFLRKRITKLTANLTECGSDVERGAIEKEISEAKDRLALIRVLPSCDDQEL